MFKLWKKISFLGLSDDNSEGLNRSIMLSNQVSVILTSMVALIIAIVRTQLQSFTTTPYLVVLMLILSFIPFLNSRGFTNFTRILISLIIPVASISMAILSKIEAQTEVFEYFDTRIVIIVSTVISLILFDLTERKSISALLLINFGILVCYDQIHELFGVGFYEKGFESPNYYFINIISILAYAFLVGSILFVKRTIANYELRNDELIEELNTQNKALKSQNEMIETNRKELISANEVIASQSTQLKQKNIELEQSVNEKTTDLIETNNELIKHNNELRQFSYTISHNLRAPVASIIGLTNIINHASSNEENQEIISHIRSSASNLDTVFRDLNKIVELRSDLGHVKEKVKFSEQLKQIRTGLKQEIEGKNVKLEGDFKVPHVYSVRPFINSILHNLVSNSIKYRAKNRDPVITVRSYEEEDQIVLETEDNGSGMDLDQFGKDLFRMYKRFHLNTEGKGLGLYLVKLQVEALNGEITVLSKINEGTTFRISFPKRVEAKDQTVIDNDIARIFYDAQISATGVIWKKQPTTDEFRSVFNKGLEIMKLFNTRVWISDLTQSEMVSPHDQEWLFREVMVEAYDHGLRMVAVIDENSDKVEYIEGVNSKIRTLDIEAQLFTDLQSARQWILDND